MKKKIAGIILASVLTFSAMAGVQASAEDRLWENSMEADGVEDDISQNQTEVKDGDDSTSEDNEENTENEGVDSPENDTEAEEDPSEVKEETEISFEEEQESIEAEVEENPEQELELDAEMGEEDLFMDNEKSIATYAGSGIPVDWVGPNYKMRPEYAFTYAFRKGVTQLSYISRKNDSLNNKIHNWFGDNKGYTTEYCQSFYACAIGNTSNTDAITAIYSNVGEYQGQIVDLKVTVPAWGTVNNGHVGKDKTKITPCVLFYKDRIAFNTISVGSVRFQFEFLNHNTSVQIYPKGHITAVDLDSGQGIRTYDSWGVDHIYLRSGYDYLRTTEGTTANGNAFREIRGKADGGNITTDDVEGWCQLDFNGSFIINWLAQDSWKNSTGAQNAFYLSTGQTIGSYEPNPGPEKRVGDENASFESMARHTFTDNDPAYEITEISFEEEQESIEAEVEENPEQELELDAEMGEEDLFMDNEKSIATYAGSGIPVDWVGPNYKMRPEYAFTYAFRKGVTQLSYISRKNDSLNNKIHNWFGDNKGYTTEYCQSFYACAIGNTSNTDAITAIYSNVGEYQGQIVDLKVTVPAWGTVNNGHVGKDKTKITPCVLFYKDRIAFNTISVGSVRFQFEFLNHNTSVQIYPKGHITAVDLDSGQGIRTYDSWGVDHIYLRSGYDYLRTTEGTTANGNAFREIRGKADGGNITTDDVEGWCQLDFNGSFIINWLAQDSWKNSTGAQNAFYLSTGQTIGSYEPNPGPEKRVGDENASFESMARHTFTDNDPAYEITEGKNFDYVIRQQLLPGNYSSFELKDVLDSCLKYRSASVMTALGNDVTRFFNIENRSNTIVFRADSNFLKTDEAYNNVTYYFRIKVQAGSNQEIDSHNHYQRSNEFYAIENTASRTIVSDRMQDTQNTNQSWVKGNTVLTDGEITVTKRIREADITWAHGNPVFRFRITGKDQLGATHVYEKYVEFKPGKYAMAGEDAVMKCSFTGIQPGTYTVSELPTLRYQFEYILPDTANVTASDKTGIVSISMAQRKAALTFKNKKTRYDRYSHTDVVTNIVPVS